MSGWVIKAMKFDFQQKGQGMTNQEAIKELKYRYDLGSKEYMKECGEYVTALGMAIEALEK